MKKKLTIHISGSIGRECPRLASRDAAKGVTSGITSLFFPGSRAACSSGGLLFRRRRLLFLPHNVGIALLSRGGSEAVVLIFLGLFLRFFKVFGSRQISLISTRH